MKGMLNRVMLTLVLVGISGVPAWAGTPLPQWMAAPVALQARGGEGAIELRWQYGRFGQQEGLSHFIVYRSVDGGATGCPYARVEWKGPNDPSFVDESPADRGFTLYYVLAVSTDGRVSVRSNTAAAFPSGGGSTSPTCAGGSLITDPVPDWRLVDPPRS